MNRTLEEQLSALDLAISSAAASSPLERVARYTEILQMQLTLNTMLVNRIRQLEGRIEHLSDLAIGKVRGNPPPRKIRL